MARTGKFRRLGVLAASAISGLTHGGRLFWQVQARPFRGPDIVRFLEHLLPQEAGQRLVL
jgi:hypothetical protein